MPLDLSISATLRLQRRLACTGAGERRVLSSEKAIREAKAVWRGTGRIGSGSTDSAVLAQPPYSLRTRFENEKGTNPVI
jgi:hypothetical protein